MNLYCFRWECGRDVSDVTISCDMASSTTQVEAPRYHIMCMYGNSLNYFSITKKISATGV